MTTDAMTIREMTGDDLDTVVALEGRLNPRPWTRALLIEELRLPSSGRQWLVAAGPAAVLGYGGTMFAGDEAHLMLLGVDPAVGRRGIGRSLCRALIADAAARGQAMLTLEVRASNESAIGLYRSLGMAAVGRRPRYYVDGEDALIFTLDLQPSDPSTGSRS